jgi:hypothetical protein
MEIPSELISKIRRQSVQTASPEMRALLDEILARHGKAAQAILFYGACLRTGNERDGLIDLYLLVDNYRAAYSGRSQALFNKLLPPNVFYLEVSAEGCVVRAKYAVLSLDDFQKGTSRQWFHSYLWGRFCQPTALLYARSDQIETLVQRSLAQAVMTFITRVLPCLEPEFSARELWREGLELSFRAEFRAERPDQLVLLLDCAPEYYEGVTRTAMGAVAYPVEIVGGTAGLRYRSRISARGRCLSRLAWRLRCLQGKVLSILRLLKAMTTFEGGVDYVLWKIERHSGVRVEVAPRLRRHPLLAMWVLSWQLYRRGGFR